MKLIVVTSRNNQLDLSLQINANILNGCEYVSNTQEAVRLVVRYGGQDVCVKVGDNFYGAVEFLQKYASKK